MGPRKGGASYIIPADLVEEILHRLPSNDLLNFKLVSKEWQRLISSPQFIKKHLERSNAKSHHHHIVKCCYSGVQILGYCANNLTSKKIVVKAHVHVLLLGSCDGLVLYEIPSAGDIGALNPTTGEVVVNTRLENTISKDVLGHYLIFCSTWFGRHPTTGEYVLVIACEEFSSSAERSKIINFRVYGLSRNSLLSSLTGEVDSDLSYRYPSNIGTFLHGRLHILRVSCDLLDSKHEILAYDLRTNRMVKMLAQLLENYDEYHSLGVVNGYLCALGERQVWMMKEYGVEASWTKYANIDDKISIPIQICLDGDVVLSDEFLKAFRDDREMAGLRDAYGIFVRGRVVACIDSLVSPAVVFGTKE